MTHDEMVALIRGGVTGGTWADFGAGTGNFTRALRELVGDAATIYAVDQDSRALNQLQRRLPDVQTITADFTQPLDLPPLDGIVMANALHWTQQQDAALARIVDYLRPGGRLVLVEYDVTMPRSYIPFPVGYTRFEALAQDAGLNNVRRIGERHSPSSGVGMYAAAGNRAV